MSVPTEFTEDPIIWPLMVQVSDCLCETLTARGLLPGDCFCGIFPGDNAPWLYREGMAWVRLTGGFPTISFPQQATAADSCGAFLGAELEVGVLHCAPTFSAGGDPPSQTDWFEASRLQVATMRAIQQAIVCCNVEYKAIGTYTPLGPQGGLFGGSWTMSIGALR